MSRGIKNLNISFTDSDFKKILRVKFEHEVKYRTALTWERFLLILAGEKIK